MLFSVLVPMFNIEEYAAQCIHSIESQSFRDFELIIVDDGSTDGTARIIDEAAQRYENIIAIHKENGGLTSARKAAAQIARGEYVVLIDGDDYVEPIYLDTFANEINENKGLELIISNYKRISKRGEQKCISLLGFEGNQLLDQKQVRDLICSRLFSICPTVWAKVFLREIYVPIQMDLDDKISIGEDGCIVFSILPKIKKAYIDTGDSYCYRYNMNSLTKNKKKSISWESCLARISFLEKHIPMDENGFDIQFSSYVVHACSNVLFTQMKNTIYSNVIRDAKIVLSDKAITKYILMKSAFDTPGERLMRFLIKNNLFWGIKVLSNFR